MGAQCQTCGGPLAHDEFPCTSCIPPNILAVMLDAMRRQRDSLRADLEAACDATGIAGVDTPMSLVEQIQSLRAQLDALRGRGVLEIGVADLCRAIHRSLRKSATSHAAYRAWHAIQQMPDAEWRTAIEESMQAVGLLPVDAAIAKEPQDG